MATDNIYGVISRFLILFEVCLGKFIGSCLQIRKIPVMCIISHFKMALENTLDIWFVHCIRDYKKLDWRHTTYLL